jgi:hypothetical protein
MRSQSAVPRYDWTTEEDSMKGWALVVALWGVGLGGPSLAYAQRSTSLVPSVPVSARVNTNVVLSAKLVETWDGSVLRGRSVQIGVGDQFSFSQTPFSTGNTDVVSQTWRFTRSGKYRVFFRFESIAGYLDSRVTVLINVTN